MLEAFFYGMILAFGLIMPLGIQNIFIFNQGATQKHFLHALPSVLTAFVCDSILILMAVLGLSVVVLTIPLLKLVIFVIGFFFLMYMGWHTWKSKPKKLQEGHRPYSTKRQISFAISVSILNPHALIDTIGVIGTSSLHFVGYEKAMFTLGCTLISFCWFFGLSVAGHFLHKLDKSGGWLNRINKLSALIIWCVALYIGWQIVLIL